MGAGTAGAAVRTARSSPLRVGRSRTGIPAGSMAATFQADAIATVVPMAMTPARRLNLRERDIGRLGSRVVSDIRIQKSPIRGHSGPSGDQWKIVGESP